MVSWTCRRLAEHRGNVIMNIALCSQIRSLNQFKDSIAIYDKFLSAMRDLKGFCKTFWSLRKLISLWNLNLFANKRILWRRCVWSERKSHSKLFLKKTFSLVCCWWIVIPIACLCVESLGVWNNFRYCFLVYFLHAVCFHAFLSIARLHGNICFTWRWQQLTKYTIRIGGRVVRWQHC